MSLNSHRTAGRRAPSQPRGDRRPTRERGFTLIELGVSLAVVVLLIVAVIPTIEAATGMKARDAAGEIGALVRYLYDHSALTGKACRIVFDLDTRTYWAECTSDRFVLDAEKIESRDGRAVIKDKLKKEQNRFDAKDEIAAERTRIEKEAEFSAFTDSQVAKKALPDAVTIEVWSAHQTERFKKGQAFLYFFPQGYTERAQIYLMSAGDTYTLVVSPLTGKVKVVEDDLALPKEAS